MTITFDARDSYDPDGKNIISYQWSFGDGATGTGMQVSHTYAIPGFYTASLTVTDTNGERSTKEIPVAAYDSSAPACGELLRDSGALSQQPQSPEEAAASDDDDTAYPLGVGADAAEPLSIDLAASLQSDGWPFGPVDEHHLTTIAALDDFEIDGTDPDDFREAFVFVLAEQTDGSYRHVATKKTEPHSGNGVTIEAADISLPYDPAKLPLDADGDINLQFLTVTRNGCFSALSWAFHYTATPGEFHWRPLGSTMDDYNNGGRGTFVVGWAPAVADFGPSPLSPLAAGPSAVRSDWETSWSVAVDCYEDPDQPECPPPDVLGNYVWPGPQVRCGYIVNEDEPIAVEPMPIMEVRASSLIDSYTVDVTQQARTTATVGLGFESDYFKAGGTRKILTDTFSGVSKTFSSRSHQAVALLTNFEVWDEWCEVSQGFGKDDYRYYIGVTEVVPLGWSGSNSYPEVEASYCGHPSKTSFPLTAGERRIKAEGHSTTYEGQLGVGAGGASLSYEATSEWGEGYKVEYVAGAQNTWDCGVNVNGPEGPSIFNASHVWTSNSVRDCEAPCQPGD